MDTNKETTNNHLNKHQHLEIGYNKIIDNNNVEDTQTGEEIGIEEYVVDITNSIEHMEDKIMVEAATNKTPTMIVIHYNRGQQQYGQPHQPQNYYDEPICYRCGQPGHLARGCRVILDHSKRGLNFNRPSSRGRW